MKKDLKTSLWSVGKSLGLLSILAVSVLWLWVKSDSNEPINNSSTLSPSNSNNPPISRPQLAAKTFPSNLETGTLGVSGRLRVSNWTQHPVRIVLRKFSETAGISEPIHWDFAPGEGGDQGLILSLPNEDALQLEKGDILMAFAQDGSRIYWGPYPMGETSTPLWNQETSEWFLILQP